MKKLWIACGLTITFSAFTSCSDLNQLQTSLPGVIGTAAGVSQNDAAAGIKEALLNGVLSGVLNLNKTNGFLGNAAYKMLLPQEVQNVASTLRNIGLGSVVDNAVIQVNRAAETAVGSATPIFTNAINEMTITDALQLVRGGNGSITNYFKQKTTAQLIAAFSPTIATALNQNSATKYYGQIVNTYNALPLASNKLNPDLTNYVATGAVNALFDQISKEETSLRQNPAARTTDLLKKVFAISGK